MVVGMGTRRNVAARFHDVELASHSLAGTERFSCP
jgi:hypothetical protein